MEKTSRYARFLLFTLLHVASANLRGASNVTLNNFTNDFRIHEADIHNLNSVSGREVQFKMFWEPGIVWQESKSPRSWCFRCQDDCNDGENALMKECSDSDEKQLWKFDDCRIRSVIKPDMCLTFSQPKATIKLKMKPCTQSRFDRQCWEGFDPNGKFQLHPRDFPDICMTTEHHPKKDEVAKLQGCRRASQNDPGVEDDTSHWVVSAGCFDGHDQKTHWLEEQEDYEEGCVRESLSAHERLNRNQFICSKDKKIRFGLDEDGKVVFLREEASSWSTVWSADQKNREGDYLIMQGDGNLVNYNYCGKAVWTSKTFSKHVVLAINAAFQDAPIQIVNYEFKILWTPNGKGVGNKFIFSNADYNANARPGTLHTCREYSLDEGDDLHRTQYVCTKDHNIMFGLNEDGRLTLLSKSGSQWSVLWSPSNQGGPGDRLIMQRDGNIVLYDSFTRPVWESGTHHGGRHTFELVPSSSGNAVLTRDGYVVWSASSKGVERPSTIAPVLATSSSSSTSSSSKGGNNAMECKEDSLDISDDLYRNQYLCNQDGSVRFGLNKDGYLVCIKRSFFRWSVVWRADQKVAGERLLMQLDGNIVLYNESGTAVWDSGTHDGSSGVTYKARISSRGKVELTKTDDYLHNSEVIWST